ncbi:MAG: DNA methyltransferase [Promethearchaeota archaeon]
MKPESKKVKEDIDYIILPRTHSPMYLMHKYWARKPANIIAHYIKKYSKPNEIVLDPFMGSGVTVLESVFNGRKAIGIDINPLAHFICKNSGIPTEITQLKKAFNWIQENIEAEESLYQELFRISCAKCLEPCARAYVTHIIWKNSKKEDISLKNSPQIEEIRISCPICGTYLISPVKNFELFYSMSKKLTEIDLNAFSLLDKHNLTPPQFSFSYSNHTPFLQLRHSLRTENFYQNLFTNRNLAILTYIHNLILHLPVYFDNNIKSLLLFAFSSALGQASKMVWVIDKRNGKKLQKRQVGSWTHHFFWDPTEYFEVNGWLCFYQRFQKLVRGKKESNKRNREVKLPFRLANNYSQLLNPKTRSSALLLNQSCDNLKIPDNSIDFIFTDPPYGDSIQYGELSTFFLPWLNLKSNSETRKSAQRIINEYVQQIENKEIVINFRQEKSLKKYNIMLAEAFSELYRVLKDEKYMVLTFHNTSIKVRNSLIIAVKSAGFSLKQILFQIPPRVSVKSMLHHSGSPIGDYYIRFQKCPQKRKGKEKGNRKEQLSNRKKQEFTESEIYSKIKDILLNILLKRGEPTFFIYLSNLLDEELLKADLFPLENLANYISSVSQDASFLIDSENRLWLNNPEDIKQADIPLTIRISDYIKNNFENKKGKLRNSSDQTTKQYVFNKIYSEFHGYLTPDKFKVNKLIEKYIEN